MRNTCFFLLSAGLLGCSTPPAEKPVATLPAAKPAAGPASRPELAVQDYLRWYAAHHEEFSADFIDNADAQDSTKYYAVNPDGADDWLTRLAASGHFAPAYVDGWRNYIRSYADTLRRHPQNDGPPAGFSYDLLMLSQEADTRLAELQAGTFTTYAVTPGKALVVARGPQHEGWREGLNFKLTRTPAGKWLIEDISVPNNLTP